MGVRADPDVDERAKTALLTRQFMKGLPKNIKIKLLESDPAPDLPKMVSFVKRYRAIQDFTDQNHETLTANVTSGGGEEMATLIAMVSDLARKQNSMEEKLSASERNNPRGTEQPSTKRERRTCFVCNKQGHIARDCWFKDQRQSTDSRTNANRCHECQGYGHFAKDCANRLNSQRATR